jgi:hypothetical protein
MLIYSNFGPILIHNNLIYIKYNKNVFKNLLTILTNLISVKKNCIIIKKTSFTVNETKQLIFNDQIWSFCVFNSKIKNYFKKEDEVRFVWEDSPCEIDSDEIKLSFNSIRIVKSRKSIIIRYKIEDCCILLLYLSQLIDYLKFNNLRADGFYIDNEYISWTDSNFYNIEKILLKSNNCSIFLNDNGLFYTDIIIKINGKNIFIYE